jgi:hypothetical protein
VNVYQHAAEKTRVWLDSHFDPAGDCVIDAADSRYYYKAPYLLTMAGLRSKGGRVAKRILERFISAQGDFTAPPEFAQENRVYAMGWLALGGMIVERFDLAEIVANRLVALQDVQSGGMILPDEDAGEEVGEVCFSGGAGMAMAATGKIEPARQMADCFVALLDAQPEKGRFYNRFRRNGSVVARPAKGEWRKIYDLSEEEQRPANFATVVNTLVWVGRATRNKTYFAAARQYVDLVYSHKLDSAQFGRATKFGWAMLNLYEETGDGDLLTHAQHLGEVLVSHQCNDGLWNPRPGNNAAAPTWSRLSYSSDCAMTVCALANFVDW